MKKKHLRMGKGFHVVLGNSKSQAAQMVLPPGAKEGDAKKTDITVPINGSTWFPERAGQTVNGRRHALNASSDRAG